MTHDAYSTKRVTVWDETFDGVAGKAIKYQDGYQSWCPEAVYYRDYQPIDALSFGHAVHALKAGCRVARAGWNGKGMWLELVHHVQGKLAPESERSVYRLTGSHHLGLEALPWIGMKTADNKFVPWLASQTDVLADDWQITRGVTP